MGSLQVEETHAYCTVNHRASASNYQLSNTKRPARDLNWRPQRLEARTLTATPPSPRQDNSLICQILFNLPEIPHFNEQILQTYLAKKNCIESDTRVAGSMKLHNILTRRWESNFMSWVWDPKIMRQINIQMGLIGTKVEYDVRVPSCNLTQKSVV